MDVNSVYKLVLYIASKNLQQGYLSPEEFNDIINQGQRSYVAYLLGIFQQYTPGRPVARVELGQNSVVRQRLAPVIYGYNLNIDVTGFSNYPGDYLQTDAMWSIYGLQRIRYADQHKLVSIYNSKIDSIATNPIYILEDSGFRFYPQNLTSSRLHYIKDAPRMSWNYTLDANGIPVYNAATSVQPVFDEVALYDIIARSLLIIGINLNAGAIMQYANDLKQSGQ